MPVRLAPFGLFPVLRVGERSAFLFETRSPPGLLAPTSSLYLLCRASHALHSSYFLILTSYLQATVTRAEVSRWQLNMMRSSLALARQDRLLRFGWRAQE